MSNWISTKDKLPEKEDQYIVYWNGDIEVIWYDSYLGWLDNYETNIQDQSEVTHWQPLPEKPKKMSTKSGIETSISYIKQNLKDTVQMTMGHSSIIDAVTTLYTSDKIDKELTLKLITEANGNVYYLLRQIEDLASELPK